MQPLDGKPTRRGLRQAARGFPTGRRATHPVEVTPGRGHARREWDALMAVVFAGRRATEPPPAESACAKCQLPIRLLGCIWTDPDGCINCLADLSAAYTPHQPEE